MAKNLDTSSVTRKWGPDGKKSGISHSEFSDAHGHARSGDLKSKTTAGKLAKSSHQ